MLGTESLEGINLLLSSYDIDQGEPGSFASVDKHLSEGRSGGIVDNGSVTLLLGCENESFDCEWVDKATGTLLVG